MKKHATSRRILSLGRETVRQLSSLAMQHAHGGAFNESAVCTGPTNCCGTESCPTHLGSHCHTLE
jgi:hypothetical protein